MGVFLIKKGNKFLIKKLIIKDKRGFIFWWIKKDFCLGRNNSQKKFSLLLGGAPLTCRLWPASAGACVFFSAGSA